MEIFCEKLVDEILFTIANYHSDSADKLCEEFEKRVGVKLERAFVEFSPVLSPTKVVKRPTGPDVEDDIIYTTNASHELFQCNRMYDTQHREILLIQVFKLVTSNEEVNQCCESTGNSALHYLVTMPGSTTPNLVRLLLGAGANLLQKNENGQNILHMIAGRMRAHKKEDGNLEIENEKTDPTNRWQRRRELSANDQVAILNVLKEELPATELTVLAKEQDENGNTAMHEWAYAASLQDSSSSREMEVASLLLGFGGLLRLPNNSGHIPLHYAFNVDVFKFLVEHDDLCHVRNDLDETPVMFMIKTIVRQVFENTYIAKYPELKTLFIEIVNVKPVRIGVDTLSHVLEVIQTMEEVRHTIWIPDISRNSIFDIVLNSIKVASWFNFNDPQLKNLGLVESLRKMGSIARLRKYVISLLGEIISIDATANELKRLDNRNPLHTLLALQPRVYFLKCHDSTILESLEILLQGGVEVNAVDKAGLNPLDIAYQHFPRQPSLYKEVIAKLRKHGAVHSIPQSFKRKIKSSCPERHLINARNLAKAKSTEERVTVVGKYRYFNDQPIGTGAFSSVFVAIKDELHGERSDTVYCSAFALKRIEKAKVNPKEISNEVKALISFSNKCEHIVKYYGDEHSEDAFFLYLCLELMDGDLEHAVTKCSAILTTEYQMKAVQDIISGVTYLHQHDFIHRDLKPTNILYTTNPTLHFKIGDFGLAKNLFSSAMTLTVLGSGVAKAPGTRCWMAPELISMQSSKHTKESDVFSLGLVLHYLLSKGKHPFATEGETPDHVIERNMVNMQISIARPLHPEAINFLQCLMFRNPKKRLSAASLSLLPFLWSERKKIEFLKAVGDQPEAASPSDYPSSVLERRLQRTAVGKRVERSSWVQHFEKLFMEMVKARKVKKYRNDKVIDLLRFIRNAYAHEHERSLEVQEVLDSNIFLRIYPTLVLDVFDTALDLRFLESRRNIRKVLDVNNLAANPK